MNYIIFDLEWNNAYNYSTQKGVNEIIEVGAIKLDEQLNIIDSFKQVIKPKISKKLSGRFKTLTNITTEEVKNGVPFEDVIADFKRWSTDKESIFMSWSNSDLYVLVDNFSRFLHNEKIDFIKKYVDVQKYCQSFIENDNNNQISLLNCAEEFNIKVDEESLHRALVDCYLSAKCFEKVFDIEKFKGFIVDCDESFFERLVFKQFYITKPVTQDFNINDIVFKCPNCKKKLKPLKKFECVNNSFRSIGFCNECKKKYWLHVRAKKTYDGIVVSSKVNPMNKKRAKKIEID